MPTRSPVPYRLPGQQPRPMATPQRVAAPRMTLPGAGGFGAKTNPAPAAKPITQPVPQAGPGKGGAPVAGVPQMPVGQQPMFNLPQPIQQPAPNPISVYQPPLTAQNPVGGFQTQPPAPTPPVGSGNFGTIQSQPAPVSPVAMPTPNPVPPQPPANLPDTTAVSQPTGGVGAGSISNPPQTIQDPNPPIWYHGAFVQSPLTAQNPVGGTVLGGMGQTGIDPITGIPIYTTGGINALGGLAGGPIGQ